MAYVTHHDHAGRAHPRTRESTEVDFASDATGELAVELEISKDILETTEGSGKDGALTVADIRRIES